MPKYKMTKKEFEKWLDKRATQDNGCSGTIGELGLAYMAYCKGWRDSQKYNDYCNS